MTSTTEPVKTIGEILDLPTKGVTQLQVMPYKRSLPTSVPTAPLIYRFYEPIKVGHHLKGTNP